MIWRYGYYPATSSDVRHATGEYVEAPSLVVEKPAPLTPAQVERNRRLDEQAMRDYADMLRVERAYGRAVGYSRCPDCGATPREFCAGGTACAGRVEAAKATIARRREACDGMGVPDLYAPSAMTLDYPGDLEAAA